MTFREPLLSLRRLVILYKGVRVYDQGFLDGVNIIRGRNSSGKSSIVDFIFFALGGDFVSWKPEEERCENVVAELEINATVVTVGRRVEKLRMQPMEIFWGTLDQGMAAPFTGWQTFPFRRSETKESFSQLLFRLLGFPLVRGEGESNITMHQVLRLICVDQLSSVLSVFRDEEFDSPLTRKTVGDLLYGIYDDRLYEDELRIRLVRRELERAEAEHSSLRGALADSGQMFDLRVVADAIIEAEAQLALVRRGIKEATEVHQVQDEPGQDSQLRQTEVTLRDLKSRFACLTQEQGQLEMEAEDSREFISNLERRAKALHESVAAEQALGRLALHVCPECLQPLGQQNEDGHCFLCKKPISVTGRQKQIAKLGYELAAQIQESTRLLAETQKRLQQKSQELRVVGQEMSVTQRRFEDLAERLRSPRDAALDDLFIKRGALESQLKSLENQRKLAERLQDARDRIKRYKLEALEVEDRIKAARVGQEAHRVEAEALVNAIAVEFLRRDLGLEETFKTAQQVSVDFEWNLCSVDNRVNFSASSVAVLKSSAHFAIFFASLELPFFRYPKFILNDNIEDKGMEEIRSQNCQRLVVEFSRRAKVRHQIIFTTSKIAPDLDNAGFCIGPFSTPEEKTLRFPTA
jgi:hypothetical protein